MKKTLAAILCAMLALALLPASGEEAASIRSGDYLYTLADDGTAVLSRYDPVSLSVPDMFDGHAVTAIGDEAFSWFTSLSAITLPASVTRIGKYAFEFCENLTSIEIPAGVTAIGDGIFYGCRSLNEINVSPGNPAFESVGGVLFDKTAMKLCAYPAGRPDAGYAVPAGTLAIEDYAFLRCRLQSVEIPAGVTVIGFAAFEECPNLTAVTLPDGLTDLYGNAFSGCPVLTDVTIPASVTYFGTTPFAGCPLVKLHVIEGSAAHAYAEENGIPYDLIR